ncbi:MAG TPA: hypothetical protein VKA15_02100 [Isosphaeraceae bacterium]|nr:hypothetical protein [Isosphaeraceae bacterium]
MTRIIRTGLAINHSGQVVGFSDLGTGGHLDGPLFQVPSYFSGAQFFNNSGGSTTAVTVHATLFGNGTATDLGTLGGQSSYASGINDTGTIVGTSQTTSGESHAFVFQNGRMTDLGTLNTNWKSGWYYLLTPSTLPVPQYDFQMVPEPTPPAFAVLVAVAIGARSLARSRRWSWSRRAPTAVGL